jgi:hypothetical protein
LVVIGRGLWRLYFVVIGVAVMAPTVGGAHNNSVAVMAPTVVLAATPPTTNKKAPPFVLWRLRRHNLRLWAAGFAHNNKNISAMAPEVQKMRFLKG